MPVRIQGRLLAELGAVLGFCLAAAGCQNAMVRNDAPINVANDPNAKTSGPLMSYLRGERPDTPAFPQGQVVSMMRPIAVSNELPANSASAFYPIQRTSAEQIEPALAAPDQPLAAAPNMLPVDGPAQQPNVELPAPNQLPPGTQQPIIVEGPSSLHPMPYGPQVPREFEKRSYPTYVIEPPDILLVQSSVKGLLDQPGIRIQSAVGMDGTINLGIYGQVYVAGMTVAQAREAVANVLKERLKLEGDPTRVVSLEVAAYNSKVYYVITDGGGYGQQVARFPATGNETVLDAMAQVGGLSAVSSRKHIWLSRATPGHDHPEILPVDWCAISQRGEGGTNYQIFPGDRLYVSSDPWVRADTWIARRLAPVQNVLGTVLLGSTTVNSLKGQTSLGAP